MAQTTEPFEEFTSVIRDLTEVAASISQAEDAKALAASEKRHEKLDGYIQEEQAYILKLRGLEQRRMRLAKSLGWENLTFRKILDVAEPGQKETLEPLFYALEQQLAMLEQSRKAAERMINVRVHEIESLLAQREGGSYDDAGNVSLNSPAHAKLKDRYV